VARAQPSKQDGAAAGGALDSTEHAAWATAHDDTGTRNTCRPMIAATINWRQLSQVNTSLKEKSQATSSRLMQATFGTGFDIILHENQVSNGQNGLESTIP
jgi:hypothetical protein